MTIFDTTPPSYGTDMSEEIRTKEVAFGDGYDQRSTKQVNASRQVWNVVWKGITHADAEALRVYFKGLNGVTVLSWTPFGQSAPLKFTANGFKSNPAGYANSDCSVTLTQRYDL